MANKSFDFMSELIESRDYLYNCTYNYDLSKEEREDLVQETLLKAIQNKDKFSLDVDTGNFRGWLLRLMYNMFVNNYKRKINHPVESYDNEESNVILEDSFAEDSDSSILTKEIKKVIEDTLPNLEYKILIAFANGYSYEQISEIFEISLGTVKSKIFFSR